MQWHSSDYKDCFLTILLHSLLSPSLSKAIIRPKWPSQHTLYTNPPYIFMSLYKLIVSMRITIMIDQSYQNPPTNSECTIKNITNVNMAPPSPRGKEVSHLGGHRPMKQDRSPFGHKLNANKTIGWYQSLGITIILV